MARPHIILIDTDQQRADTIARAGSPWMVTPNLDALSEGGVLFTRAFSSAATCMSSRASFYSGLYPHNTGIWAFDRYTGVTNWTHRLRAAGYRCVSIGKTHICGGHHGYAERLADQGNKNSPRFADAAGPLPALWCQELQAAGLRWPYDLDRLGPDYDAKLCAFAWPLPSEFHPDAWMGRKAVEWIDAARVDEPLFLHIGFMGPHEPYDPPQACLDLYGDDIPAPEPSEAEQAGMPRELRASLERLERSKGISAIKPSQATPQRVRRMRRHYFANVTLIDEMVGRIVAALDRKGWLDNAIVVFTSDHGDHLFDHGLFYKGELYDSVVNVPLIVRGPNVREPGRLVDDPVSQLDVAQYLLGQAEAACDDLEGVSLAGVLEDGAPHPREYVFAEEGASGLRPEPELLLMIRSRTHKLVHFPGNETGQLFDLVADPGETLNLWGRSDVQEIQQRLRADLLDWLATSLYRHRNVYQAAR